jgi:hypothetical protein
MTSTIDATKPITGNPTTQSVRDNFASAKAEIESLQLARVFRLAHVAPTVEIFQQCAVNDVAQVIQFNQQTFKNPNDNSVYELDVANHEIIFHQTGWYSFSVSIHIDRKSTSGADATWAAWSQLKLPAGAFTDFPDSLRKRTMAASAAIQSQFVGLTTISRITVADSRLRIVQACSDVSKQIGVVSYPPVGVYPSAPGIIMCLDKLGDL